MEESSDYRPGALNRQKLFNPSRSVLMLSRRNQGGCDDDDDIPIMPSSNFHLMSPKDGNSLVNFMLNEDAKQKD